MDVHFAENGLSTSDKVLRRESFRELIADVHELPETQRTALLLREIDALSYEQIAEAMETTVPSVKSLLVRARISLAEAAEARKLSCEEVRLELGEVAEGLGKLSTPARRHVRGCERCAFFKKQLKDNNHALAAIMPVAPLLLVKKVLLAKLGTTASAGGAHVAAAPARPSGASAGASAAAGGSSVAGGLMTAGAGALATKAVAGLAAAAIVTAGAVAADHAGVSHHHHAHPRAIASAHTCSHPAPVVVREHTQPITSGATQPSRRAARTRGQEGRRGAAAIAAVAAATTPPTTPAAATPPTVTPATPPAEAPAPGSAPSGTQVTEVTSQTTELPPDGHEPAPGDHHAPPLRRPPAEAAGRGRTRCPCPKPRRAPSSPHRTPADRSAAGGTRSAPRPERVAPAAPAASRA